MECPDKASDHAPDNLQRQALSNAALVSGAKRHPHVSQRSPLAAPLGSVNITARRSHVQPAVWIEIIGIDTPVLLAAVHGQDVHHQAGVEGTGQAPHMAGY